MRKITLKLKFEIVTEETADKFIPNIDSVTLTSQNKLFQFAFIYDNIEATSSWGTVRFEVDMMRLDIDTYVDDWIASKFIKEEMTDEEIEDEVYNVIKRATLISGVNMELINKDNGEQYSDKILLTELKIFDINNMDDETILDLMDLKLEKYAEMANMVI